LELNDNQSITQYTSLHFIEAMTSEDE